MSRLRKGLAAGATVFALAGTALAAGEITGRERPPAAAAVTIASTAPLFQEAGLVGGQTLERCTVLTNEGPQPADVTLFGSASQADLSPWLELELVRGTLPDGTPAGDCTGFLADADDYGDGTPGVVFRGTLDQLPGADDGIADPTRWAVGERHAYLLRVHYSGDDPQQGLQTVQNFSWGATPFDDRPPEAFVDPGQAPSATPSPAGDGAIAAVAEPAGAGPAGSSPLGRACTVVSFPSRTYIGARAISKPKKIKKKSKKKRSTAAKSQAELGSSSEEVISAGEDPAALGAAELDRRAKLLAATKKTARKRAPVLVVRLKPGKGNRISVQVGLRKNGKMLSPKRWKWVRVRLNRSATKSTLRWPFTAKAKMAQLKLGYNQIDLTLHRGSSKQRVKGLPSQLRRSFAFVVGYPKKTVPGGTDCTLG